MNRANTAQQSLRTRAGKRLKASAGTALRLSLTIAASLILAEVLVRFVSPQQPTPLGGNDPHGLTIRDSELGYTLKPNFEGSWVRNVLVRTNAIGLRDIDYGDKEPRELRILSLGDSYAFGWGVEIQDSYPKVVERFLSRDFPACKISVVNGAVSGFSTYQEIIMLKKLYASISPDFVISTFSAANDVIENATIRERIANNSNSSGGVLARNSHIVRLLLRVFADAIYFAANRWPSNIDYTVGLMSTLEEELEAKGIPFEMVIIPARHQVRPHVHAGAAVLRWLGMDWLLTYQNSRVRDHFENAGSLIYRHPSVTHRARQSGTSLVAQ